MNLKQLRRKYKKRAPKAWAKAEKHWETKMVVPVMDFIFDIGKHINPKAKKAVKKNQYLYSGSEIEREVWKLLKKVRRITQGEKK